MAAISTMVAVGAVAVAGGSAIAANKMAKKQVKAQNEALQYQRQQNDLQAARQRRDAVRAARMARANAQNSAATQGVMESSGNLGGLGSIQSQLNDNISFLDQYNQYSDMASQALGRANEFGRRGQLAQTIGGFAMSVFGSADYIGGMASKVFGSGAAPAATASAGKYVYG